MNFCCNPEMCRTLFWGAAAAFLLLLLISVLIRPRLILRFFGFVLRHTFVRLRITGLENIPGSGPVLLVSNHVSFIDLILIQLLTRRMVRFMVHEDVYNFPVLRPIFRFFGVIRVPSALHPKAMQKFLLRVRAELRLGGMLCLFPEGGVSGSGGLMRFRSGVAPLIPKGVEVTVVPLRIGMLWGRLLVYYRNHFHIKFPNRLPVDFSIRIGKPVSPDLSNFQLRQVISELGAEAELGPQPGEVPLHTVFLQRAKRHPFSKVYMNAEGKNSGSFTLLLHAVVLSKLLRKLDLGDSGYVGVLLPNCTIMISLMHGVLLSDHTPAVINFSAGQEVALEAARRAGITKILTSTKFLAKLGWAQSPEMLLLEDAAKEVTFGMKFTALLQTLLLPSWILARILAPRSAYNVNGQAVLLFSSGSTGKPKAVMLTHRNMNCDIWSFWRMVNWTKEDKIAGNLPIFHAYGCMIGFAFPALSGTPVYFVANPLDGAGIVKSIADFSLTILTATPTFLQSYLRKATREQLRSLRLVITGAEKLRPELAAKFRSMTGREIIEGYGCTELSPIVTINVCHSIYRLGKHADHVGSIGIPLPGIHVRVVDQESGVELGANEDGRMQVKSGIIMKGYLNDPEQTARVIQNGYYDTGDIARIDEEGYIYITGRATRFSKIGGEMVPHELVEENIAKLRGREEREVAVTGRPDAKRGERLVVFYTPADFDPEKIVEELRQKGEMPNLWIPKKEDFVKIDALPLLGSGKLNLRKLKEMADLLE